MREFVTDVEDPRLADYARLTDMELRTSLESTQGLCIAEGTKVISRAVAYHGTPQGALSITGIPDAKKWFEPLVPGAHKVANTNFYRAPEHGDEFVAHPGYVDELRRSKIED